jgi:tight adherence protein B
VGGNLAEVLDAVGHTIRERNAIRRQVKALSAEGKLSAIVLMVLPFGIIGFISLTNPGYLAKFTESIVGYGMLAVAALMLIVGGLWLKKTVAIRF